MTAEKAQGRGEAFLGAVQAEYELTLADQLVLEQVQGVVDEIAGLPAASVTERRQQRMLLSRLLSQLALPDLDSGKAHPPTSISAKGRKAARARWDGRSREGSANG